MTRRSHEFESAALELDHLHTRTRARRSRARSFITLATVSVAVMLGGGAMLSGAGGSPVPRDPAANSVHAVAGAPTIGPATGMSLNEDLVDIAATPSGRGYWAVASDGGVFGFGDAANWIPTLQSTPLLLVAGPKTEGTVSTPPIPPRAVGAVPAPAVAPPVVVPKK